MSHVHHCPTDVDSGFGTASEPDDLSQDLIAAAMTTTTMMAVASSISRMMDAFFFRDAKQACSALVAAQHSRSHESHARI